MLPPKRTGRCGHATTWDIMRGMDSEPFDMNCLHPIFNSNRGPFMLPTVVANQGPSEQFFCLPAVPFQPIQPGRLQNLPPCCLSTPPYLCLA